MPIKIRFTKHISTRNGMIWKNREWEVDTIEEDGSCIVYYKTCCCGKNEVKINKDEYEIIKDADTRKMR